MKLFSRKKPTPPDQRNSLLHDIARTKFDLDIAYSRFENVVDPEMIDSYIYEVNAVQKRYNFLIGRAKQLDAGCF